MDKSKLVKFVQDKWETLKNESCVEVKTSIQHLALYPFHLENVKESINNLLNKDVAKYSKE